ncbi:antitoxin protein of toxin-antitoxin system [Kribbella rubisoli]|uniref:Antitoxin protein of toxin-antitoxin system n=1 Tax=Kribbella rubisoli TaxID=3075929 RepID=A0A4V2FY58_9ACTN|nr:antitoxin [Kribbella rubisoli]RZU16156.1 antitoxin protein of toxin-antitoxin system [Kribbella rubisoli]
MGMFDNMKDKAADLVNEHGEQVGEGLDKAGDFVDEKTGGKYGDKIDQGTDLAKDQLDNLDGENDDIPDDQS